MAAEAAVAAKAPKPAPISKKISFVDNANIFDFLLNTLRTLHTLSRHTMTKYTRNRTGRVVE